MFFNIYEINYYHSIIYICFHTIIVQTPSFHFEHITSVDGLAHNIVNEILQDSKGFMWFTTGLMEFLDILVMPTTGECDLNNKNSYSSPYQKVNQKASPGYYKVQLDKPGIVAELTSTERCGFHKP